MNLIDSPNLQLAGRFLNLAAYRQTLIAGNIANVDTPGYHTLDIDFRQEMHRSLQADGAAFEPRPAAVPGLMQRPDGNDVSIDRESMALAESQLQFRLGVEAVRHEFRMLSTAVHEGASS
jgi:flagellar basal-body rod protein FlgB